MHLSKEILKRFKKGLDRAAAAGYTQYIPMDLATVGANNRVSSRIVLLKHYDEKGFVFYTNLTSRKGLQLAEFPYAALTFFWEEIEHQVRVEGKVEKIKDDESDEYFASRPRLSQVGAWVSQQSQVLESRALLVKKAAEFAISREGRNIQRPKHWGGLRLDADRVEFWYGKKHRLHDRFCYQAEATNWVKTRLYP